MKFYVCYDIPESKIRTKVTKCLQPVAYRIQYSVFAGNADITEIRKLQKRLEQIVSSSEKARLLVLLLSEEHVKKCWTYGIPLEEKQTYVLA